MTEATLVLVRKVDTKEAVAAVSVRELVEEKGKTVTTLGSTKLEDAVEEVLGLFAADVGTIVSAKEDVGFVSITKPTDIPL